ncbi:hypothetical protein [Streptomyces hirsutus]|uniref:hypothetical protein n=1 Tax=Streptomyces hirsutus TaxID=35620 RepID=UPI0033E89796
MSHACVPFRTHELGIQPDAYDPKPDVDFTPLREQAPAVAGPVMRRSSPAG